MSSVSEKSTEIVKCNEECAKLRNDNAMLKGRNDDLREKLLKLEYHQRRNNLRFDGIDEPFGETDLDCYYKVIELLQHIMDTSDAKIARCHRVGPYRCNGTRAIITNFHWYGDITTILQNKRKLSKGKCVNEDLPDEWLECQRIPRPVLKQTLKHEHYRGNEN